VTRDVDPLEQLTLEGLRRRTSQKWQGHDAELLPLWVAEMDVLLAPEVEDALMRAIREGDTGYSANHGYAEAVAGFAADRWGWGAFPVGATRVLADVMSAIVEVVKVSSAPGDAVVVTSPVYAPFFSYLAHADREVVQARLTDDGRLDPQSIRDALGEQKRKGLGAVLLLSNPHNPTGTVPTRAELEGVAEVAQEFGVRVLSDEIHAPLTLPGATFTPYLTVAGSSNAVAFVSASKGWNLAGVKAALAVAGVGARADLAAVPSELDYAPSHLGVLAHTAAFRESRGWLDALLLGLDKKRSLLDALLKEHVPGVTWHPSEGTYLAWLDCRALEVPPVMSGSGFAVATDIAGPAKLFHDHGVALNSGHIFGDGGDGFVRLNFATTTEVLTEAVTRMGRAVGDATH